MPYAKTGIMTANIPVMQHFSMWTRQAESDLENQPQILPSQLCFLVSAGYLCDLSKPTDRHVYTDLLFVLF